MALTECPDCGKDISNEAFVCPKCGRPTGKQAAVARRANRNLLIWVVVLTFALASYQAWQRLGPK
jgi:predicted amidophosphoribosyltransferase